VSGARCQGITVVLITWALLSALAGTRDPFTAFLLMMGGLLIIGGYAIANSLFGGTVPLIGAALQKSDQVDLFFTYVTVAIGISLLVYIFALKNRKQRTWTANRATPGRRPRLRRNVRMTTTISSTPNGFWQLEKYDGGRPAQR
jgi:hypothetical protein